MYKFFFINSKFDKGFIVHRDWEHLHFEVTGEIIKVTSNKEDKIDKWANRNDVIEITEEKAETDIKQYQLNGLKNRKTQLEKELTDTQNRIDVLGAV